MTVHDVVLTRLLLARPAVEVHTLHVLLMEVSVLIAEVAEAVAVFSVAEAVTVVTEVVEVVAAAAASCRLLTHHSSSILILFKQLRWSTLLSTPSLPSVSTDEW